MNIETITPKAYATAVAALVPIALDDTSGSRAAAQVLLGTYNAHEYHVDLTDLCILDGDLLEYALTVIAGRARFSIEPQRLIVDGDEVFRQIWEQWEHLRISRRYRER